MSAPLDCLSDLTKDRVSARRHGQDRGLSRLCLRDHGPAGESDAPPGARHRSIFVSSSAKPAVMTRRSASARGSQSGG
jgi:hypothetical protein